MERVIEDLKKIIPKIEPIVKKKVKEFKENFKSNESIFKELCFCILTANFNAEKSVIIQKEIDNGFLTLSEEDLAKKLKELGHRYPNTRARYIVESRKYSHNIKEILGNFKSPKEAREFLVKNIKGLGYKESSHFLRNIGFLEVAIIDYHIIDLLMKYNLIKKKPKAITKKKYLQVEQILEKISKKLQIPLGELDLYLWYMETGKVVK